MFGIGMQELVIILVVALIFIGPQKLPEVARTLAKGMRELRKASDDLRTTIMVDLDEPPPPPRVNAPALNPARPTSARADEQDAEIAPAISGSVAVAAADGVVSRGATLDAAPPDPDDAEDHRGMVAPDAHHLQALIDEAKKKLDAKMASTDAPTDTGAEGEGGGRS